MANNNRITKGEASVGRLVADDEIRFLDARGSVTNVWTIDQPSLVDFYINTTNPTYRKGRFFWDADHDTFSAGIGSQHVLKMGQEILFLVQNDSGDDLAVGTVVMGEVDANGRLKTVGDGIIKVVKAVTDGTYDPKLMIGVVTESILNGARGFVTVQGEINNYNTNGLTAGDILYPSPSVAGTLGTAVPTPPSLYLPIAVVTKKSTQGSIYVRMTQGHKLADAHDVLITSPSNGQVLKFNGTAGYWYNAAP